ncbi:MAG: hypothetical protein AB1599_04125 [Planctomycetota bacterium]
MYKSEGSPWATAYAQNYPEPFLAGPSGSIYNPTDTSLPSSARFYYSGYLGDHSLTRPGIRLGVRLQDANPLTVKISNHTRFAFEWFNFEKTNEAVIPIVPRENYQSVHTEGNNVWIQVSGQAEANVGDTVTVSVYGELLNDSGLYNGSLVRTDASGVTTDLIRVDGVIGNEFGPETVSYEVTAGGDETCTGTMQDIGSTPEGEPQSVYLKYSTRPIGDFIPPILYPPVINPLPNVNGWNNKVPVIVTPSGIDPQSPPDQYTSGLAGIRPPDATFSAEGAGQTVTFVAYDYAGNRSTPQVVIVNIDLTPPITWAIPDQDSSVWYGKSDVPILTMFFAEDPNFGSGVASIDPPFVYFSDEGIYQQEYTATDNAGNKSDPKNVIVQIDLTAPVIKANPDPGPGVWYNHAVEVTFTANDQGGSGLVGPATNKQTADTPANTWKRVNLSWGPVFDNAGNESNKKVVTIQLDKIPPELEVPEPLVVEQMAYEVTADNHPEIKKFLESAKAKDSNSGVKGKVTNNAPAVFKLGINSVTFTALDNAGNKTEKTVNVTVQDTTRPVITSPKDIIVVATEVRNGVPGTPKSNPKIQEWLNKAKATDICDPNPTLTNNAPDFFYTGITKVTFKAQDRSGNVATREGYVTVVRLDLQAKGHDFNNPKTGEVDISEEEEGTIGAYAHYNIDNDNGNMRGRQPVADKDETGPVANENDLKRVQMTLSPFLYKGRVTLWRNGSNLRVWRSPLKGSQYKVLFNNDKKTWDLANPSQRDDFLRHTIFWVEGYDQGSAFLNIKFEGEVTMADTVRYTFIAATCGRQPKPNERTSAENGWENLVHCEWSITGEATQVYNCIAWTVGETNVWYNPDYIDRRYGDRDGIFEDSDMDAFYFKKKGWRPIASGPEDAKAMYYSLVTNWNYGAGDPWPSGGGYHGAKKMLGCTDGSGKWIMFESKTGEWVRMEHVWNQLNGASYRFPTRFYK